MSNIFIRFHVHVQVCVLLFYLFVVSLLNEEFALLSPAKLESLGFLVNVTKKQKELSETQQKMSSENEAQAALKLKLEI